MSRTWLKNLFIVVFFGVQLYMALPGLLYNDYYEDRGRFSWNMFSVLYQCNVQYRLIAPDGQRLTINHRRHLNNQNRSYEFLHRKDVPKFNAYLCNVMRQRKELGEIHASVDCRLNYRPRVEFIEPNTDICTAPNYGVRLP